MVRVVVMLASTPGPVTVTVIDDSDHVGWAAAATRIGEYTMTNVVSFVQAVHRATSSRRIGRLNVLDHGNRNGFELGTDWITLATLPNHRSALGSIAPKFARDGWVHLQGCNVGLNPTLMQELANLWGVRIVAGTGLQNPVYRFNTGSFVECLPNNGGCRPTSSQMGSLGFEQN